MNSEKDMDITFWGVRGSIPTPLTGQQVEDKIVQSTLAYLQNCEEWCPTEDAVRTWMRKHVPRTTRSTYGGNTPCVQVQCGKELFILDMGTGIRELGNALMPETIKNRGLTGRVLQSHLHWDHLQGYPFWPHLYLPRAKFNTQFDFYGGHDWETTLEDVLRGQMSPPEFPVRHQELEHTGLSMKFHAVWDTWSETFSSPSGDITVMCRKLNHPQETYGYRISFGGHVLAYTTDHEPYAGGIHQPLLEVVSGADIWIADCQYSKDIYTGAVGGVQHLGWGHSFPEYIAEVAWAGGVKRTFTFHHDPAASDEHILALAQQVEQLSGIPTSPACEQETIHLAVR